MTSDDFQGMWLMGGHGVFVWASVAACIAVIVMEVTAVRRARRLALRRLQNIHLRTRRAS